MNLRFIVSKRVNLSSAMFAMICNEIAKFHSVAEGKFTVACLHSVVYHRKRSRMPFPSAMNLPKAFVCDDLICLRRLKSEIS